jgi:ABC-type nitrate/sulfonate/bicarbonate transport system permease component
MTATTGTGPTSGPAISPRATLVPSSPAPTPPPEPQRSLTVEVLKRMGKALINGIVFVIVGLILWEVLVKISGVTPYIAKSPGDVYHFLFTDPTAAANRAILNHAFWTTARDMAIGFVAGTVAALVFANIFALRREVEQAVMPVAMILRTVPLVAMVPLIALIFGRGIWGVAVIAGIVTFFPTLVNVTLALRAIPQESFDLMHGYGATRVVTLRKVQFPGAMPALFASARIAAPLALTGALLAEWLATGKGAGYLMLTSSNQGDYNMMWASVVLVVVAAVLLYSLLSGIETLVLDRYAPGQNRRVI